MIWPPHAATSSTSVDSRRTGRRPARSSPRLLVPRRPVPFLAQRDRGPLAIQQLVEPGRARRRGSHRDRRAPCAAPSLRDSRHDPAAQATARPGPTPPRCGAAGARGLRRHSGSSAAATPPRGPCARPPPAGSCAPAARAARSSCRARAATNVVRIPSTTRLAAIIDAQSGSSLAIIGHRLAAGQPVLLAWEAELGQHRICRAGVAELVLRHRRGGDRGLERGRAHGPLAVAPAERALVVGQRADQRRHRRRRRVGRGFGPGLMRGSPLGSRSAGTMIIWIHGCSS